MRTTKKLQQRRTGLPKTTPDLSRRRRHELWRYGRNSQISSYYVAPSCTVPHPVPRIVLPSKISPHLPEHSILTQQLKQLRELQPFLFETNDAKQDEPNNQPSDYLPMIFIYSKKSTLPKADSVILEFQPALTYRETNYRGVVMLRPREESIKVKVHTDHIERVGKTVSFVDISFDPSKVKHIEATRYTEETKAFVKPAIREINQAFAAGKMTIFWSDPSIHGTESDKDLHGMALSSIVPLPKQPVELYAPSYCRVSKSLHYYDSETKEWFLATFRALSAPTIADLRKYNKHKDVFMQYNIILDILHESTKEHVASASKLLFITVKLRQVDFIDDNEHQDQCLVYGTIHQIAPLEFDQEPVDNPLDQFGQSFFNLFNFIKIYHHHDDAFVAHITGKGTPRVGVFPFIPV